MYVITLPSGRTNPHRTQCSVLSTNQFQVFMLNMKTIWLSTVLTHAVITEFNIVLFNDAIFLLNFCPLIWNLDLWIQDLCWTEKKDINRQKKNRENSLPGLEFAKLLLKLLKLWGLEAQNKDFGIECEYVASSEAKQLLLDAWKHLKYRGRYGWLYTQIT